MELMPGMVVRSVAGHDQDRFYVIVKTEAGYAYIADGKRRRLEAPKRKNPRHLRPTRAVMDLGEVTGNRCLAGKLSRYTSGTGAGQTIEEG